MDKERILVVEDEANARCALADLLRNAGYEVATANNGVEGLERLSSFAPEFLLTDLRMPGMSGLELAQAARSCPRAPTVVLMSANPRPAGVDVPWLEKPLRVDELLALLAGARAPGLR